MKRIYILLLACVLFSCAEDLGNYDYRELVEPEISGIDADLSVLTYGKLQLTPDLGTQTFPDEQYSYEWKVIAQSETRETVVIGTTRNLEYEVVLSPGSYVLFFTMTERKSGVFWQKRYNLQVNEATSEGWMVLCSDQGKTRLDMVSMVTGETYRDILKTNGMPPLNGPRRIQWLGAMFAEEDSPFYLLTDDGATRLGKNNFDWKEEYRMYYEMGGSQSPTPHSITLLPNGKMMVSGTEAYFADCLGLIGLYGSPVNKTFSVAPFVGTNISTQMIVVPIALLYDTDNKRFMGYAAALATEDLGNQEALQELNQLGELVDEMAQSGTIKNGVVGTAFDRFPQGLDYVYMENTKYDPGNAKMGVTYTVLADGDKRYLYGIQLGDILTYMDCPSALGKAYYGDISACTGITRVTDLFAFSSLRNYMYYAVGGTVYRVNLSERPLKAVAQFTLSGETITCLKFNLYQKAANASRSYDLVVGSVKGDQGTLRVYEGAESEGDFRSVKPTVYTGFARIVDATYREMLE